MNPLMPPSKRFVSALAVSADETRLFALEFNDSALNIFDLRKGAPALAQQIRFSRGHETAVTFGALAARIKKAGRDPHVRVNDLWLAAQAIQRDFQLLTSNRKDFADIPRLRVVVLPLP